MKKKNNLITITIYLFITSFIFSIISINHFEKVLGPSLLECAENQVEYLTNIIINNGIKKYTQKNSKKITIKRNTNNTLYDTKELNTTRIEITQIIKMPQKLGNIK